MPFPPDIVSVLTPNIILHIYKLYSSTAATTCILNGSRRYGRVEKSFQFYCSFSAHSTMAAAHSTGVRIELLFCDANFPFIILLCVSVRARAPARLPQKLLCRVPVFLLTIIAYSTMCLLNHFHKENSISNFPFGRMFMFNVQAFREFVEQTKVVRFKCWEFNKCICLYKFGLHLFHGRSLA